MINILLCGSEGKMGRAVKNAAEGSDICIAACVDPFLKGKETENAFSSFDDVKGTFDGIIDFSHPSVTDSLIAYAKRTNTPAVICTTGLSENQIAEIYKLSETSAVFFSANMSLGVNLLVELCKKAALLLGEDFDIEIIEKHHNQKVDAPSGTALMLANEINAACDEKYEYVYDRQSVRKKREKTEIGIHAVRGGNIVGEHEVIFAGRDECVSLKHAATSKEVFAVGAINAARFMKGKTSGLYNMKDLIK